MSIKEVFCQDKAISVLQKALSRARLAHAYIFDGAEGVGKFKTAREFAKLLLCKEPVREADFADSCGRCESCRSFEAATHPDFSHIYKELITLTKKGKGRTTPIDLPIDVIREFLVEKIASRPILSARRVFVVSEAEKLNTSAQNALLKTLEEPPEYCCIILLCTKIDKLLPTTRSRCQVVRFAPVDEGIITARLVEDGLESEAGRYFAKLAQGSMGMAVQLGRLESEGAGLYKTKQRIVNDLCRYRYGDSLDIAEKLLDDSKNIAAMWGKLENETSKSDINRRADKIIIMIIVSILDDAMKLAVGQSEKIVNFDQAEQVKKLSQRWDGEQCAEKIAECYRSTAWLDANVNEKLIFEQLLLNLAVSDTMRVYKS